MVSAIGYWEGETSYRITWDDLISTIAVFFVYACEVAFSSSNVPYAVVIPVGMVVMAVAVIAVKTTFSARSRRTHHILWQR